MSHSRLAANKVPIDRGASDEAARAGKLQVLLVMGSGVVAAANGAIICVPMIRSDLGLGLDLAGLTVATFATLGAMTSIGAGLVIGRMCARRSLIGGMGIITLGNVIGASAPPPFWKPKIGYSRRGRHRTKAAQQRAKLGID
jgi:predicted MFS family arabinose efflux permease